MTAEMILAAIALILLLLAAIGWPQSPIALGWLGLFFYVLAQVVPGFK